MNHAHDEWVTFRDAHHCRVVGKQDSRSPTGVGFSSSGKTVFTTSNIPAQDSSDADYDVQEYDA